MMLFNLIINTIMSSFKFNNKMSIYIQRVDIRTVPWYGEPRSEYEEHIKKTIVYKFKHLGYGEIENVELIRNKRNNHNYYIAFIYFSKWYETHQSYLLQRELYNRHKKTSVWIDSDKYWVVDENRISRETNDDVPPRQEQFSHLNTIGLDTRAPEPEPEPEPKPNISNYVAYDLMDDINKKAINIMKKDGVEAAVDHMMKSANMDYATMRSMYG